MRKAFQFQDGWRTYSCHVERRAGGPKETLWWWFSVTGDQHTYAPFPAASDDTQENVQERVLAFHLHRLARRAEPPVARYQAGRPPKNAPKPAPQEHD
jgi:hypothetical protein